MVADAGFAVVNHGERKEKLLEKKLLEKVGRLLRRGPLLHTAFAAGVKHLLVVEAGKVSSVAMGDKGHRTLNLLSEESTPPTCILLILALFIKEGSDMFLANATDIVALENLVQISELLVEIVVREVHDLKSRRFAFAGTNDESFHGCDY